MSTLPTTETPPLATATDETAASLPAAVHTTRRIPADWTFWGIFLLLNGLLFVPLLALNWESNSLLPWVVHERDGSRVLWNRLFFWRTNYDLFRLNLELVILLALWVNVPRLRRSGFGLLVGGVYVLALLYAIYEAVTLSIFHVQPIFFNQYHLVRNGIQFLFQHLNLPVYLYLGAVAGLLLTGWLVIRLLRMLLNAGSVGLSRGSRTAMVVLPVLVALFAWQYSSSLANTRMAVSSLTVKLERNISTSFERANAAANFDDAPIRAVYDFDDRMLAERPNIYVIFVESYGSVLFKRPDYRLAYGQLLRELDEKMGASQWQVASAWSDSPTWGGGSWMAYTSALFGLQIEQQPEYQAVFNKFQYEPYPGLADYLHGQGYQRIWLTSLASELSEHEWLRYRNFYGIDQWVRWRDLNYVGPGYGWGPAPPDQYALHYTNELIKESDAEPFFLFFITQNSHYPWTHIPPLVEDWRTLNNSDEELEIIDPEALEHVERRRTYFNAIEYELRMLTDFVLNEDDDSIIVLIGDHQPPRVSRRDDGWATPVHVFSRNPSFLETFRAVGFQHGMQLPPVESVMKHAGFYTLFLNALLDQYGEPGTDLPEIRLQGIPFTQTDLSQFED